MRTEANKAGNEALRSTEGVPDEGCLKFMSRLSLWGGVASSQDLGPQTSQDQNRARQKCKRRGWVTYDYDGYWRLTDSGKAALSAPPRSSGRAGQ